MALEQEKEPVERAKSDTGAFGELYDQYYSQIFGYVLRRTARIEIAEDVTSFTCLNASSSTRVCTLIYIYGYCLGS
jgi:DNA-directed RNA polymerase specialized sigma24 family protein